LDGRHPRHASRLFDLTAGYRSRFSRIVVVDPRGLGQPFDPLAGGTSEDECLAAAVAMLDASHTSVATPATFVMRAAAMLAALFRAAALEDVPGQLYARQATRHDLLTVAQRLRDLDPALAVQLLATDPDSKGWQEDRFLRSYWGTLVTRVTPLVTEVAVRTFNGLDSFDRLTCTRRRSQ
jgi:hypothetical protein